MNIKEIVENHLKEGGFEGLYNSDIQCACELEDLAPCAQMQDDCEPGYKCECDCGENCDYHISAEKPEEGNDCGEEKTKIPK
jgi:hypothetical protein